MASYSRNFRRAIFPIILLVSLSVEHGEQSTSTEFEWPRINQNSPAPERITSTFAESRKDHFHNGVDIAANGEVISPVAAGRILYSRETDDNPFRPTGGPGNVMILRHEKGYWSGYYHLQDHLPQRKGEIAATQPLGRAGNTGHSAGGHLHFFLLKNHGQEYLNPLDHLPPMLDTEPPIIGQLMIITPKGKTLVSHSRKENIRLTKAYPIYLQTSDAGVKPNTRRGVYRLRFQLNDRPEENRSFSTMVFEDGQWKVNGMPFSELYFEDYYALGELPFVEGKNTLNVRAEDAAGNTTKVTFDIHIDRK